MTEARLEREGPELPRLRTVAGVADSRRRSRWTSGGILRHVTTPHELAIEHLEAAPEHGRAAEVRSAHSSHPVYGRSVIPDRFRSSSQPRIGISSVPATLRTTSAARIPR